MKKIHIISLSAIIAGIILFLVGAINDIAPLGIMGFLLSVAGLIILMFTTATGIVIFISSGIIIIFVILIIFGPVHLTKNINGLIQHYENKDSVIEIPAVVTLVDESTDGEGGTNYSAYVSYSHSNKTYNNVYWKIVEDKSWENSDVTVKISTKAPEKIFRSESYYYTALIFPLIITLFLIGALINLPIVIYREYKARKHRTTQDDL